jgi:hypothetical protein
MGCTMVLYFMMVMFVQLMRCSVEGSSALLRNHAPPKKYPMHPYIKHQTEDTADLKHHLGLAKMHEVDEYGIAKLEKPHEGELIDILHSANHKVLYHMHKHHINDEKVSPERKVYFISRTSTVDTIDKFLCQHQDVNVDGYRDKSGWTPIMWAANRGKNQILEALINHGANINAQSDLRLTPLMLAGAMGLLDSVKLLVAYCADLELKSLHGTADEYAYALRNKDIGDYIKRARGEKRQCKTPARRSCKGASRPTIPTPAQPDKPTPDRPNVVNPVPPSVNKTGENETSGSTRPDPPAPARPDTPAPERPDAVNPVKPDSNKTTEGHGGATRPQVSAPVRPDAPAPARPEAVQTSTNKTVAGRNGGGATRSEMTAPARPDTAAPTRPDRAPTHLDAVQTLTNKTEAGGNGGGATRSDTTAPSRSFRNTPSRPNRPPAHVPRTNSDGNATNPDPLTQPTLADLSNKIKHIDDSVNGDEGNGTSNSRLR